MFFVLCHVPLHCVLMHSMIMQSPLNCLVVEMYYTNKPALPLFAGALLRSSVHSHDGKNVLLHQHASA